MLGFADAAGRAGFEISVLSGSPEETHRYYGFTSYPRRDFKEVERALAKCDALVFPGGSIFQDVTSVKSVAFYQKVVHLAKKANKKVFLVGQGVGPLESFFGKRMAADAFNLADGIAVRDSASIESLKAIGVKKTARATADSAFLLPTNATIDDSQDFGVGNMKVIGIAPRPLDKKKGDVVGFFTDFCRLLYQSGSMPVLIPMDRGEDGALLQEIAKRQGSKIADLAKVTTPMEMQKRIARMDMVIAMRLHAGILAANAGVPPLMVSYDPKVTAFSKQLGLGSSLNFENLTPPRLLDAFLQFQKDRERNEKVLERKREELRKLAEGNLELVVQGLGKR